MSKFSNRIPCNNLNKENITQQVLLYGWANTVRDHGGLIFVDLRDRSGLVQTVFDPDKTPEFESAKKIRSEFVLQIKGEVRARPPGTENTNLQTGEVEVLVKEFEILNTSKPLPFQVDEEKDIDEKVRLKYRYIDFRRQKMKENLYLRHLLAQKVREFYTNEGFYEVETPFLIKSTPEGARDFLVPSRFFKGNFYALPQSPQLFKQILMIGGIEKYFQIVRCFRDEDLRADRQPEFTQIDVEMSFVDVDDIIEVQERLVAYCLEKVFNKKISLPLPRITYNEAIQKYGSDKPDLRFALEIQDVSQVFVNSSFKVFKSVIESGGKIKVLKVAGGTKEFSRTELDKLIDFSKERGAKGLAYIQYEEEIKSPILKFFSESEIKNLGELTQFKKGDLLLFVADKEDLALSILGEIRLQIAKKLNLIPEDKLNLCWIVEFPLLEYSEEEKRFMARHHPFTSPYNEDILLLDTAPEKVRAKAYDLVLNGVEIAGGSIRIHQNQVQQKMFKTLGISDEEANLKFGFLLEALQFGAPPHGGIAFGFDRLLMLLLKQNSIRDVIPFPKTQTGTCLMTGAPYIVDEKQLKELGLKIVEEEKKI